MPVGKGLHARVSPGWQLGPLERELPGSRRHLIVAHQAGAATEVRYTDADAHFLGQSRAGSFTALPPGARGRLVLTGTVEATLVLIPPDRLRRVEAKLSLTMATTMSPKLGVVDDRATAILDMLALTRGNADVAGKAVHEKAMDLFCIQLVARLSNPRSASEQPSSYDNQHQLDVDE